MDILHRFLIAVVLPALAMVGSPAAHAQTTDGYHSYQVFPVVVDTAAFAQRFVFKNPSNADITNGNGNNSRGVLEVESNEQNTGEVRPYKLFCRSGSGMNALDRIRYKEPVDRF